VAELPHTHIRRATKGFGAVARGETYIHARFRDRLLAILWVTVALVAVSTIVVYAIERNASGAEIDSLFDAFLFSASRLLTASSIVDPQTNGLRILELGFDVYAITVVAALAGSFGAFFHAHSQQLDAERQGLSPAGPSAPSVARQSPPQS
jgi:ABC-type Co2+ transport system permease subunit